VGLIRRHWRCVTILPVNLLSRRQVLAIGAVAAIAPQLRHKVSSPASDGNPFTLGVCAGDPDERSAVLWTRLTQPDGAALDAGDVAVTWELADDDSFESGLSWGEVVTRADEGHSVHVVVDVTGPSFFRFHAGDSTSPIGRVAPTGVDPAQLRLATASCQHFETGFFSAHRDLAEWAPDLVIFLGDFIYEYSGLNLGGAVVRNQTGDETMTIDDYRHRYGLYLADNQLQAARAACPWLVIWDDHEVDDNYAGLAPADPTPPDEFAARRLAAYQAWWEHMPVRIPRPSSDATTVIYRSISWGPLAELLLLDGRQFRADQSCGDVALSLEPACPQTTEPSRTMLGADQERWLGERLAATSATWPVIAQQTVLTDVTLPNGAVLNYDQWDGYPAARQRLLLQAAQAQRTIVLTGDIHLAAVGTLPGIGVEFVTTSITSPGLVPEDVIEVVTGFPDVVDAELTHRGYTRHTVTRESWTAEYRMVDDVADPKSTVSTWKTFTVDTSMRDDVAEV
jgi:alkaline phosphatase D